MHALNELCLSNRLHATSLMKPVVPFRDRGSTVVKVLRYKIGRSLVRFQMVSLEFFIDIILPIALWPWGRPSL